MNNIFDVNVDLDKFYSRAFTRHGEIPDLWKYVERGVEKGTKVFADKLFDELMKNITKYGLMNSMAIEQIYIDILSDGIILRIPDNKSDYAMFIEYGTGVVGESSPHPWASKYGWEYDVNEHGESGWWYPTSKEDNNPTKYFSESSGIWKAWTRGQASRPFMYDTWRWARQSFTNTINVYVNKEIEKWKRDVEK